MFSTNVSRTNGDHSNLYDIGASDRGVRASRIRSEAAMPSRSISTFVFKLVDKVKRIEFMPPYS